MKPHINLLFSIVLLGLLSCATDDDILTQNTENLPIDTKVEVDCSINFDALSSEESLSISCDYDLEGQTVVLPPNVTLIYNGGMIKNGTLKFQSGLIDGNLLNIDLEIEGAARLLSTDFSFDKTKWDIKEGEVSDAIALQNKENLNEAIQLVKDLKGYKFSISDMDAYFQVRSQTALGSYNTNAFQTVSNAIQIPSNFHFAMDTDVHIRVQPNNTPRYALLGMYDVDNVTVTGGNLWGDRYEHTNITGTNGLDTHEWGFLVYLAGVHNAIIDGVTVKDANGDGVYITAKSPRRPDASLVDGNRTTENAVIRNCTIDNSRRNNFSPVDGNGIIIENNLITNAGVDGILPKCAIDLESYWVREADGTLLEYQRIENVIVRNNTFIDSENADLILYTTNNVEIYGNSFTKAIANTAAFNIKIHDNTFTGPGNGKAINIRSWIDPKTGEELNHDYEIYNNRIEGFHNGIIIAGDNQTVHHNTIINCKEGISLFDLKDASFHDNVVESNVTNSYGYRNFTLGSIADNVQIKNEILHTAGWGTLIKVANVDDNGNPIEEIENGLTFDNCSFSGHKDVDLRDSNNITIMNSTFDRYLEYNSVNITLINNNTD